MTCPTTRAELRRRARRGDLDARTRLLFGPPVPPSADELLAAVQQVLRDIRTQCHVTTPTLTALMALERRATHWGATRA